MAYLNGMYFSLTKDPMIDALTHGFKWDLSNSRTINWSISGGVNGERWINPNQAADTLNDIFANISSYANINFSFSGQFFTPASARAAGSDINVAHDGAGVFFPYPFHNAWAIGFFPDPTDFKKGDIYINMNSQANTLPSFEPGSAAYALMLHEIGHTLGLKHPHDDGGTTRPEFKDINFSQFDKDVYSVMSYADDYQWNLMSWDPATPMPLDVLGLQYLYGKNEQTNAGNTSHYLTTDSKYKTIWDASGYDWADASFSSEGWIITLPEVQLSTLVDTKIGIAEPIPNNPTDVSQTVTWLMGNIENIAGSKYADILTGNSFDNNIIGSGGNDTIDGGNGRDTCYFAGKASEYKIVKNGNAFSINDISSGWSGIDVINNVETLKFSDYTLILDQSSAIDTTVYQIYQAALARMPDTEGFLYWANAADNLGLSALDIAKSFVGSQEFAQKFGSGQSNALVMNDNANFINKLYNNVLGREADADGLTYWLKQADAGRSEEQLLVDFATSPENVKLTGLHTADNMFWTV